MRWFIPSFVRRTAVHGIACVGAMALLSCADDQQQTEEPVSPGAGDTDYGAPDLEMPPTGGGMGDEDVGTSDEGLPNSELSDQGYEPSGTDEDNGGDEEDTIYSDAFESDSADEPWQDVSTGSGDGTLSSPGAVGGSGSAAPSGDEVVRYVDAKLLNVRNRPSFDAPIVRRLRGGTRVTVEPMGRFSKVGPGEYVSSKYLSASPTERISKTEIRRAWERSEYKDTWEGPDHP